MIEVTFNGEPFDKDKFAQSLMGSVQKVAVDSITRIAKSTVCPEHKSIPSSLTVAIADGDGSQVKLSGGCCDVYIKAFQEKLAESNRSGG